MIYIIYLQLFTSVHLKQKFDLIYINLYNLHLYSLICLLYVLYSASIRHAGIIAIEKQCYYYYYIIFTFILLLYYIHGMECVEDLMGAEKSGSCILRKAETEDTTCRWICRESSVYRLDGIPWRTRRVSRRGCSRLSHLFPQA